MGWRERLFVWQAARVVPTRPDMSPVERRDILLAASDRAKRDPSGQTSDLVIRVATAGAFVTFNHYVGPRFNALGPVPDVTFFVLVLAAVIVVTDLLRARQARPHVARELRARGRCTRCAYDLRETPDRCPECGLRPAKGLVRK